MAINIEWQALPAPNDDNNSGKQPKLYPRMIDNETADFQQLCQKIAKHGSHTKGTVISVMSDMVDVMKELLGEGKTIDLDELGTFKLSIGTDNYVTPDTPYQKRKVAVRGVNFQPCKLLMDAIGTPKFRTVPRNASTAVMTADQLQSALLEYLETHDSITRSKFQELYKLKRTTACDRLKELQEMGVILAVGSGRETVYIKKVLHV